MNTVTRIALPVVSPSGQNILRGRKRIEVRSWRPETWPVRDLLIVENHLYLSRDLPFDPQAQVPARLGLHEVQVGGLVPPAGNAVGTRPSGGPRT